MHAIYRESVLRAISRMCSGLTLSLCSELTPASCSSITPGDSQVLGMKPWVSDMQGK